MRRLLERLGVPGVLGFGLLCACLAFHFSALVPAERELTAQRAAGSARARADVRPVGYDPRGEELERFYALFPPVDDLADELETLYALARKSGLELQQGEYRIDRPPAGLAAYRVVLPVRGSYAQVRAFTGAVLARMPFVSLDALRFERRKSAETQLEAQLRLTVYLRSSRETP